MLITFRLIRTHEPTTSKQKEKNSPYDGNSSRIEFSHKKKLYNDLKGKRLHSVSCLLGDIESGAYI